MLPDLPEFFRRNPSSCRYSKEMPETWIGMRVLSSPRATTVSASPVRERTVGISEKKKSPKSMAATGSAEARIDAFPVSM